MTEIELLSPAKINLYLAVTGRREDGFHSLISLVAPLTFGDRVTVSVEPGESGIELECSRAGIPLDKGNLAWRAASAFLEAFDIQASVRIGIDKKIPVGAGLGGGSSNAATMLLALTKLFEVADSKKVTKIAESLGSDCPLFLRSVPQVMRGRGEQLDSIGDNARASLARRQLVLFKPSFGIATPWAYRTLAADPSAYTKQEAAEAAIKSWKDGDVGLEGLLFNSFERAIGKKYGAIPLLLKRIRDSIGSACLMSGSGSCCYALAEDSDVERIRALVVDCWGNNAFFRVSRIEDI